MGVDDERAVGRVAGPVKAPHLDQLPDAPPESNEKGSGVHTGLDVRGRLRRFARLLKITLDEEAPVA